MKKTSILLLALCSILLNSCLVNKPLTGKYQETPFITYSDKPFNEVWSKVIDIFAQKGITINVIDRSSGLIVSTEYSFKDAVTVEKGGKAVNSKAWVVVNYIGEEGGNNAYMPQVLTGNFNVRLKEEEGKTSINVNLTNLKASYSAPTLGGTTAQHTYTVKSTGVFEREIAEQIK